MAIQDDFVMKRRGFHPPPITCVAAVMVGSLTGCTQPPLDQFKAAKKAIQSARAAGASEYARDDHAALEQDFVLAKNELIRPGNVFLPFQSFSDAEKLLVKVAEDAEHVAANAAQNKEMAKAAGLGFSEEIHVA